ncbi:MAG: hypothetical protein FWJ70_07750 [Micromonosporaceae bacterium]|jgi:hypothetical protein
MAAVLAHAGHRHGYGPGLGELRPVALVIVAVLVAVWLAVVVLQSRATPLRLPGVRTGHHPGTGRRSSTLR